MITRYESNKEILNIVSEFVENNKDIRFVQALYILGIIEGKEEITYNDKSFSSIRHTIVDKFNEESEETLRKLKK